MKKPRNYLTTVIGTIPAPYYGPSCTAEVRFSFIRRGRTLTARGAERLIRRGSDDRDPCPSFIACRIETAVFSN